MYTLHRVLAAATRLCVALALVLAPWANSMAVPAIAASAAVTPWANSMAARALAAPEAVATVGVGNSSTTFSPISMTIAVSDTVHWVWNDLGLHSTTSGNCGVSSCAPDGKWDSGAPAGMPFTFDHVFTQTGIYNYYCSVHGPLFGMRGTIEVVDFLPITGLSAANSSPTPLGSATAFTATVSSGNPMTYTWSFGDAQAGSGALTSHTYGASGFYTAVVTVSNPISTVVAFTPVTITTSIYLPLILR